MVPTGADVAAYLSAIEKPEQRADAHALVELMRRLTSEEPRMWGPGIVGFGTYHYRYPSGHEGDAPLAAFAPRKGNTVVYMAPYHAQATGDLQRLGKHKASKGCLYIKRLADIDMAVLERIVAGSIETTLRTHGGLEPEAPGGGERGAPGGPQGRAAGRRATGGVSFAASRASLGAFVVAWTSTGVRAIALGDEPATLVADLRARYPEAREAAGAEAEETLRHVTAFLEDPRRAFGLPLDLGGTPFQRRVWEALREIPAGRTATYAELAERLGQPTAVRAVAGACAANEVAVAVPCHRVLRKDGSTSGYRWGVERKRALLAKEARR